MVQYLRFYLHSMIHKVSCNIQIYANENTKIVLKKKKPKQNLILINVDKFGSEITPPPKKKIPKRRFLK